MEIAIGNDSLERHSYVLQLANGTTIQMKRRKRQDESNIAMVATRPCRLAISAIGDDGRDVITLRFISL